MAKFTLYGWDFKLNKTLRVKGIDSFASIVNNGNTVEFNIFDEARKALNKKPCLFLDEIKINNDKTGFAQLAEGAVTKKAMIKNVKIFTFGYDMQLEKAEEMIKKIIPEDYLVNDDEEENEYKKDLDMYYLAKDFELLNEEVKKQEKLLSGVENVLRTCENGEIFQKGNKICAVFLGVEDPKEAFDEIAFKEDAKKDPSLCKYISEGNSKVLISVDSGIKKVKAVEMIPDRNKYTNEQLFKMAYSYNEMKRELDTINKQLDNLKKLLKNRVPDDILSTTKTGGQKGSLVLEKNGSKLIITKSVSKPMIKIDTRALKKDGLFDKYIKKQRGSSHFVVKNLA